MDVFVRNLCSFHQIDHLDLFDETHLYNLLWNLPFTFYDTIRLLYYKGAL